MAEPYFIWKGTNSNTMGVVVRSYPPIVCPKERTQDRSVPGRPGSLTMLEGTDVYEPFAQPLQCYTRPTANLNNVIAWLRGSGQVTLGRDPTMAYTARIDAQMSLEKILANHEHRDFIIPFVCQPFKHLVTPASNIEITASGGTITNPGTVASLPIILVEGTGTIGLTIGGTAIEIDGSANGIIIDCTIPDCFSFDRSVLMNSYMTGEFPTIPPGTSYVTWTGTVTKVTITPNWRWL